MPTLYLLITKALDYFDLARSRREGARTEAADLSVVLQQSQAEYLVISFTTDWRFSPEHSHDLVQALVKNQRKVTYAEIDAPHGHDAFLLTDKRYHNVVRAYFNNIQLGGAMSTPAFIQPFNARLFWRGRIVLILM